MSLTEIECSPPDLLLPDHVADYLRQMAPHVEQRRIQIPAAYRGFVPSDYVAFYCALSHVVDQRLACGSAFCEWGSGLGVATCLASELGFNAYGIEIDEELCQSAEQWAAEFKLPSQFVRGSFLPADADGLVDDAFIGNDGCISMFAHADDAYALLGREIHDFDVIYAFPWPNDENLTTSIFERFAATGALLLTYHEDDGFRLRRK